MNQVNLIGNVGTIIFDNKEENSRACIVLSLATSEKYIDKAGNEINNVTWHKLTFFGNSASFARKLLNTGARIFVTGKLRYSDYVDKDGSSKQSADIVVSQFIVQPKA